MRLVHTADLHLDACFASTRLPAQQANRRRQSLRDTLAQIVQRAGEWPADALLIAGDLFDQERLSRDTVAFLKSTFGGIAPVPVVIAPGNHDPFVAESPYTTEEWPDNVLIFSKPEWESRILADGQLVVHGFAFDGYELSTNPFGSLRIPEDDAVHVAVGHGTERAHQPPDGKTYAPFDAADAAPPGLAYLALGHFHSVTEVAGPFQTRMFYSGAPESQDFGQKGVAHYLEVEIEEGRVEVKSVPSSRVVYDAYIVDCGEMESAQALTDELRTRAAQQPVPQIARLTLRGACPPSFLSEIPAVLDAVAPEFEYLDLVNETTPLEDYEELARETTSLGAFVKCLNERIADAPDAGRRGLLVRAREIGVAAYREQSVSIRGIDAEGGGS
ncbi:MAG: hypothetical protein GWP08_18570 [Nitrospiraceae bacterium]|nr:hypothetical protein [Nitrospiraceae bacterium]